MGFYFTKIAPKNVKWLRCFANQNDLISFFIVNVNQIFSLVLVLQELPTTFSVMGTVAVLLSKPPNTPHEADLAALDEDFASLPSRKSEMLDDGVATTDRVEADKSVTRIHKGLHSFFYELRFILLHLFIVGCTAFKGTWNDEVLNAVWSLHAHEHSVVLQVLDVHFEL